jgi:hypothetical protein
LFLCKLARYLPCRGAKVTKFAVNIAKRVDGIGEFGVFEGN